jgi:hypothetical protein
MTTEEILGVLAERGLSVVCGPDGVPRLRGRRDRVTPTLLAVLRWHRAALAARFAGTAATSAPTESESRPEPQPEATPETPEAAPRPRQWRWPGNLIMPDFPPDKGGVPSGATHWRYWGETEWKEVGRGAE